MTDRTTGDIVTTLIDSPLGPLTAGATEAGICLLAFPARSADEVGAVTRRLGAGTRAGENAHLVTLRHELAAYFAGARVRFSVPLQPAGTPFQQRVWARLLDIPYGRTWSYAQLAEAAASPRGQRAVGHANGSNPIAIVIPCHRVINKSGKLGGYGGELWRKRALLALESGQQGLGPGGLDEGGPGQGSPGEGGFAFTA